MSREGYSEQKWSTMRLEKSRFETGMDFFPNWSNFQMGNVVPEATWAQGQSVLSASPLRVTFVLFWSFLLGPNYRCRIAPTTFHPPIRSSPPSGLPRRAVIGFFEERLSEVRPDRSSLVRSVWCAELWPLVSSVWE